MDSSQSTAARKATQAELARELGVARQSIHELVARGVLSADADGLIDADLARQAIARDLAPHAKTAVAVLGAPPVAETAPEVPAAVPPTISSYHVARTLREAAEARIAQLNLAERQRQLVSVEDVRRAATGTAHTLVRLLDQIPARIAAEFGTDDAQRQALRQRLQGEIDQVREEVSRAPSWEVER